MIGCQAGAAQGGTDFPNPRIPESFAHESHELHEFKQAFGRLDENQDDPPSLWASRTERNSPSIRVIRVIRGQTTPLCVDWGIRPRARGVSWDASSAGSTIVPLALMRGGTPVSSHDPRRSSPARARSLSSPVPPGPDLSSYERLFDAKQQNRGLSCGEPGLSRLRAAGLG